MLKFTIMIILVITCDYFLREWTILNLLTIVYQKELLFQRCMFLFRDHFAIYVEPLDMNTPTVTMYMRDRNVIYHVFFSHLFTAKNICVLQCCEIIVYPMDNYLSINKFIILYFSLHYWTSITLQKIVNYIYIINIMYI